MFPTATCIADTPTVMTMTMHKMHFRSLLPAAQLDQLMRDSQLKKVGIVSKESDGTMTDMTRAITAYDFSRRTSFATMLTDIRSSGVKAKGTNMTRGQKMKLRLKNFAKSLTYRHEDFAFVPSVVDEIMRSKKAGGGKSIAEAIPCDGPREAMQRAAQSIFKDMLSRESLSEPHQMAFLSH